jgi:YceI-like domain
MKIFKMRIVFAFILLTILSATSLAQTRYFTKTGKITFYSKSPMENIEAVNNKVVSVWDVASGQIEFNVLMKGFEFEKALMQEHFNENYVESDKYPKAVFKGIIENSNALDLTADHSVSVKVNGNLTIHGETRPVNTTALITVKNKAISAATSFVIILADYKISIPSLVADKINKKITINVNIPDYRLVAKK